MSSGHVFGVDAGTSVVKAVAFDQRGEAVALASRRIETRSPKPGWAEQDLEEVLAAVGVTIRRLTEKVGTPDLLAITAQGDGLWLLDRDGRSVRPPILWSDARAASYVARWDARGISATAYRANGNIPFAGSAAALLHWIADHEPEVLNAAVTAGYASDALRIRLTGKRETDAADASLPFLDVRGRRYDGGLLTLFGLDWAQTRLAPIAPAEREPAPLTTQGAEITGLPVGTPVHIGPFDFPSSLIGSGVGHPGDGLVALGTTLACGVITHRVDTFGEPSGMTICLPNRTRWVRLLPAMAGTLALDWLLPLFGLSLKELDATLQQSPPGANGLIALPHVSPSGERAPFVDPHARGRLIGLSTDHGRADIVRAVCEGIAFAARHCLESGGLTATGSVTIAGGGGKSSEMQTILASVLGRPLFRARQPEPGARGAAILALRAAGAGFDEAEWTRPDGIIPAIEGDVPLYESAYRRYRTELDLSRSH